MINISEADKALWKGDSVHKSIVINIPGKNVILTNEDIKSESMILVESINDAKNLTFQGCIASKFEVTLVNFTQDIRNEYIEVTMTAGESSPIPIFSGFVDEQSNINHEDFTTKITAFDPLKQALDRDVTSWYNSLVFPTTIKAFRTALFSHLGIVEESVNLASDNLSLAKTYESTTIVAGEILRDLCQLNGVFGQYGRDKKFHYHKLVSSIEAVYPAEDLYPADDLYPSETNAQERVYRSLYRNISYQPFYTFLISRVIAVGKNGNMIGSAGDTSADTLYIADNKLAWGVNANEACQNILAVVHNLTYTPAIVECKGLPYVECGDIVLANTRINVVQSYVLSRTLRGLHALMDEFDSTSDQGREPYKLSQATEISTNQSKAQTAQSTANTAQNTADTARSEASGAQSTANTANTRAVNAQGTADWAIQRVGTIEADYVKTASITAVNGRIDNLSATVAVINNAYITRAQCQTIVSQSIQSYWAGLTQLSVSGNISCGSISQGGTTFTKKSHNVRLANGNTQQIIYLGFS